MSPAIALQTTNTTAVRQSTRAVPTQERAPAMVLRWAVSRRALGYDSDGPDMVLAVAVRLTGEDRAEYHAVLLDGDRVAARPVRFRGEASVSRGEGLIHLDAPGGLRATVREGATPRTLYAWSGILSALGLAGGRYEVLADAGAAAN